MEAATELSIPIGQLASRLDRIQVVALARTGSKRVKVVLQKLDREQSGIVRGLGPARFVPNRPCTPYTFSDGKSRSTAKLGTEERRFVPASRSACGNPPHAPSSRSGPRRPQRRSGTSREAQFKGPSGRHV